MLEERGSFMKKTQKQFYSALLIFAMMIGLFPAGGFVKAENPVAFSENFDAQSTGAFEVVSPKDPTKWSKAIGTSGDIEKLTAEVVENPSITNKKLKTT